MAPIRTLLPSAYALLSACALLTACASLTLSHTPEQIERMPLHTSKFWTAVLGKPDHGGVCFFAGWQAYSLDTRQPYLDELRRRGFDEFELEAVANHDYYQGMRAEAFKCAQDFPFDVEYTVNGETWLYCEVETDPDTHQDRCIGDTERFFYFYNDNLWGWH